MITVDEMMTENPHSLQAQDTLDQALALMARYGYHHIPITEEGKLVGLVSHRDVLGALSSSLQPEEMITPQSISIAKIMTADVFSVQPDTGLRKAALYIRSQRYGCLPVVQDGKLVGIITDSDFVNIAADLLEQLELTEPSELEQLAG